MYDAIIKNTKKPCVTIPKLIYHIPMVSLIQEMYKDKSKNFFQICLKTIGEKYLIEV